MRIQAPLVIEGGGEPSDVTAEAARIMHENSWPADRTGTWWTAEIEWPDGTTAVSGPNRPGEPCGRGIVARWLEARCRERVQRPSRITLTPHAIELG